MSTRVWGNIDNIRYESNRTCYKKKKITYARIDLCGNKNIRSNLQRHTLASIILQEKMYFFPSLYKFSTHAKSRAIWDLCMGPEY